MKISIQWEGGRKEAGKYRPEPAPLLRKSDNFSIFYIVGALTSTNSPCFINQSSWKAYQLIFLKPVLFCTRIFLTVVYLPEMEEADTNPNCLLLSPPLSAAGFTGSSAMQISACSQVNLPFRLLSLTSLFTPPSTIPHSPPPPPLHSPTPPSRPHSPQMCMFKSRQFPDLKVKVT